MIFMNEAFWQGSAGRFFCCVWRQLRSLGGSLLMSKLDRLVQGGHPYAWHLPRVTVAQSLHMTFPAWWLCVGGLLKSQLRGPRESIL